MDYDEIIQKLTTHMSKEMAIEALENTKEIYEKAGVDLLIAD